MKKKNNLKIIIPEIDNNIENNVLYFKRNMIKDESEKELEGSKNDILSPKSFSNISLDDESDSRKKEIWILKKMKIICCLITMD